MPVFIDYFAVNSCVLPIIIEFKIIRHTTIWLALNCSLNLYRFYETCTSKKIINLNLSSFSSVLPLCNFCYVLIRVRSPMDVFIQNKSNFWTIKLI